eukprot:GFUD01000040.1.p1 GENE.GFUD01000040.1~~GFUD01000040.1.p1  ORF type:complete len:266 (-),score=58.58 GFUD01000040.1:144-941(-)
MECESYNLNWAEFDTYTSLTFKELLAKPDFTDVTLACGDEESIEAHKVILSACSPVFSRILKKNTHSHPLIFLTDVTHGDLKAIINFMYLGQTNVAQEDLQRFLKVATKFEVRGLTENNKEKVDTRNKSRNFSTPNEEEGDIDDVHDILDGVMVDDSYVGADDITVKSEEESTSGFYHGSPEERKVLESSFKIDNVGSSGRAPMMDDENKYPCDQCDYKATFSCNLTSHKRTVHEGLFFYCNLCAYKSSRKDRLNKHVLAKHGVQ